MDTTFIYLLKLITYNLLKLICYLECPSLLINARDRLDYRESIFDHLKQATNVRRSSLCRSFLARRRRVHGHGLIFVVCYNVFAPRINVRTYRHVMFLTVKFMLRVISLLFV